MMQKLALLMKSTSKWYSGPFIWDIFVAISSAIFSFEWCERVDLLRIFTLASVIKDIYRYFIHQNAYIKK